MSSGAERRRRALEAESDPARWRAMFHSLRLRMALSHGAVILTILVFLGVLGQALLARQLDRSATTELRLAVAQAADRLTESQSLSNPPDSDLPGSLPIRVGVFGPGGRPVDGDEPTPEWLHPRGTGILDIRVAGQPVRTITQPVREQGRLIGTVVAARSLVAEASLVHRVRLLLLFGGVMAVAASMLAGWLLAGRALRPVRRAYAAQAAFAADASHELRTPLAFVRQGVEVLAERDDGRPLGRQVVGEVDYLSSLLDRLLQLARADDGRLHLAAEPIDVAAACAASTRRARVARGVVVEAGGTGRPIVRGDATAIEAALDAVLENVALHGGGSADLRWRAEGGVAVIEVADHGPGLAPEHRQQAFRRFFRADPVRAREHGGAGLGLSIARELVLAQGGSIELDDTPGGGLTVRLGVPLDPAAGASAAEEGEGSADAPRDRDRDRDVDRPVNPGPVRGS
ncbi:MAG TPA: HAMP domain-containing sensor histidine kinase [Actinomycetota bacterium]|nr:HAMP domain-containing sensor histidine kinase [Actinomycetota bacterium]